MTLYLGSNLQPASPSITDEGSEPGLGCDAFSIRLPHNPPQSTYPLTHLPCYEGLHFHGTEIFPSPQSRPLSPQVLDPHHLASPLRPVYHQNFKDLLSRYRRSMHPFTMVFLALTTMIYHEPKRCQDQTKSSEKIKRWFGLY